MNPTIRIHNTETDEITDREMTESEFDDYKLFIAETKKSQIKKQNEESVKQSAQAKLAALGLTPDEVAAIVGN